MTASASARFFSSFWRRHCPFYWRNQKQKYRAKNKSRLAAVQGFFKTNKVTAAWKIEGTRTGCVFTEVCSICAKLKLLWMIISTCRRHRKKSEEGKLQIFYYPVSWQYFACNFAVYVTLTITDLRKVLFFRRLFPHEEMIKLPKLSSVEYVINKLLHVKSLISFYSLVFNTISLTRSKTPDMVLKTRE